MPADVPGHDAEGRRGGGPRGTTLHSDTAVRRRRGGRLAGDGGRGDARRFAKTLARTSRHSGGAARDGPPGRSGSVLAIDRPHDHSERSDLRQQPRQRFRARVLHRRFTRRTPTAFFAARQTAACGRASTGGPPGRREPTTRRRLAVGALAYDRRIPRSSYCGTGEGNWWSFLGAGILRSTDGGTTWAQHCTAPVRRPGLLRPDGEPGRQQPPARRDHRRSVRLHRRRHRWTLRRGGATWSVGRWRRPAAQRRRFSRRRRRRHLPIHRRRRRPGRPWRCPERRPPSTGSRSISAAVNPAVAYAWGAAAGAAFLWRRAGGALDGHRHAARRRTDQAWYDWFVAVGAGPRQRRSTAAPSRSHRGNLSGTTWTWVTFQTRARRRLDPSRPARDRLRAGQARHALLRQ